jgi:hypothetical protein
LGTHRDSPGLIRAYLAALAQTPILWQQLMILRRNSQVLFGLNVIAEQQFNNCFNAWTRGYKPLTQVAGHGLPQLEVFVACAHLLIGRGVF